MGYERYPRNSNLGDYYGRPDPQDFTRDYGSGRDYSYSSARDYAAAGEYDRSRGDRDDRSRDDGRTAYGQRASGPDRQRPARDPGFQGEYRGSYASDGHRFADVRDRGHDRDDHRARHQDRDQEDRGFFDRAGDEVRSWFGDEEAERRRERDSREDERRFGARSNAPFARDEDYHSWRRGQIAALDRDYDEYRRENRSKFENEFGSWRTERQTQRGSLSKVEEHMDVVGSDGEHVGTVDKVRGDRIILTKSDSEAGGRHHSIPSRWIQSVDTKVTIRKTADDAHAHWRDEERNRAFFNEDGTHRDSEGDGGNGPHVLNRSFSGTY